MITPRIRLAAIVAGLALLILAGTGVVQTLRLLSVKAALADEKRGRADDRSAYAQAQAEATEQALAIKLKRENDDAKNAALADARFNALRDRYAAILRAKSAGGASGGADLPRATGSPGVPETAAGGAGFPVGTILIAQSDALICADNTAYAQAAHDWAARLDEASAP